MNKEIVELIGGVENHVNRLSVIASRPSHGKTKFALDIAMALACDPNRTVVFITLESSYDDLKRVNSKLEDSNLTLLEAPNINLDELMALIDSYNPCSSYTTVFIDNLQMLIDYNSKVGAETFTSNIMSQLKRMSLEMKVNIVLLSQLNRGVENRENRRPQITDLRESANIEAMADLIMLLYREHVYNQEAQQNFIEVSVAKNRFGERRIYNLCNPTYDSCELTDHDLKSFFDELIQNYSSVKTKVNVVVGVDGDEKTNLMLWLKSELFSKNRNVYYITGEIFMKEFLDSIQKKELLGFNQRFYQYDVILFDKFDDLKDKAGTQRQLTVLLNELQMTNVIFFSKKNPSEYLANKELLAKLSNVPTYQFRC